MKQNKERKGPGHQGPGSRESQRQPGRGEKKKPKTKQPSQGQPQHGGGRTRKKDKTTKEKVRRTKTRPGGRPARPGQEEHARAHTRGTRAWRPTTRKGRCRRSHETAPVHRPSPPSKGGRYRKPDASVTGSTHANHRSAHSPRPKPEGPARDNPIAGPGTGTTRSEPTALASAGASGRHKEPGSRPASTCPAQPPSKAGGDSPRGGERHHGDRKADRSTESDRTGRGAAHQHGATRHAREATTTAQGQVPSHNGHRVPRTREARKTHNEPRHKRRCQGQPGPHTGTPRIHDQLEAGPGRTPERTRGRRWERARPRTPHTMARGAPPRRPRAAPTARKASSQERALWGW